MRLEQIFEKVSAEISDVRVAVHRRPAGVHLHLVFRRIEGPKFFERARVSVEQPDCHVERSEAESKHLLIFCGSVRNAEKLEVLRLRCAPLRMTMIWSLTPSRPSPLPSPPFLRHAR